MIGPNSPAVASRQVVRRRIRTRTPKRIKCPGRNLWLAILLFINDV